MMALFYNWIVSKVGVDRLVHFVCSAIISSAVIAIGALLGLAPHLCLICSILAIATATVVKECLLDRDFDCGDALANLAGAAPVWIAYMISLWE